MIQSFFNKNWPHFAAIGIFLLVSVLFCKPVTEGKVLAQHDVISWKGMSRDAFVYKEKNGHFPLWNTRLFGGMPNYQVAMDSKSILPDLNKVFSLGLPKPINFFFLACIGFYILCLAINTNVFISILGALSFAFATYNPVIISAGHESKMMAIIYMPVLLAGLLLIYQKRYWLGLGLSALAATMEIGVNHIQVTFYLALIIAFVTIAYLISWIRQKEWKHAIIALSLAALSALIALGGCAVLLMPNYEYAKTTMRGGGAIEIKGKEVIAKKTTGLDTDYAFEYSLGKAESFVTLMPEAFGGSSRKTLPENSKVIEKLSDKNIPESDAQQIASGLPLYWGQVDGAGGISGPAYIGAISCILALLAFAFTNNPIRWGLLGVSVLAFLMSWGKYLPGFNTFLFNNLPLYNKFRAPSMALVVMQVTFPLLAVLGLQNFLFGNNSKEQLQAQFKKALYLVGGLFGVLLILYVMMDYSSFIDQQILQAYTDPKTGDKEIAKLIVSGMKADRRGLFGGQILRSLMFTVAILGCLFAFVKNKLKAIPIIAILALISLVDLFIVGRSYLSDDFYQEPDEQTAQNFEPNAADAAILKDTSPHYRVYFAAGNAFTDARTPYFHRSIGGYHPAKLRIYQDVISRYFSDSLNPNVLNMLDVKYTLFQNKQNGQAQVQPNPDALGAAWFVKEVKLVNGPVDEINAIGYSNPKDAVFIDNTFKTAVTAPQWDSTANIQLVKYDNDLIEYKTKASKQQFAVLSEVYYPYGWNAYIDGKKTDYAKVNYILRGISVPAGEHKIEFKFEPGSYTTGRTISFLISILLPILFFGGIWLDWRQRKKTNSLT